MKSMLQMSEEELAQQEAGHGFRLFSAIGLSVTAALLALLGMMSRYAPGDQAPLPGMNHLAGQCALAVTLGAMMLVAGWLVHNVIMKRLQWAIVISLLLHLILVVGLHRFTIDLPLADFDTNSEDPDASSELLRLPDYGGMEALDVKRQAWERATETKLRESPNQEIERQVTEVDPQLQPKPVSVHQEEQVDPLDSPTRQQQQERLKRAAELEMQRQIQDASSKPLEEVDTPQVSVKQARRPELEAAGQNRNEADPRNRNKEREQVARRSEPRIGSARMKPREEVQPTEIQKMQAEPNRRNTAQANPSAPTTESVRVATRDANRVTTEARPLKDDGPQQADLPSRQDSSRRELPSRNQVVNRSAFRPAVAEQNRASVVPRAGGAAAMQRNTKTSDQATSAVGASARAANAAAARGVRAPQLNATATASQVSRGRSSVPSGGGAAGTGPRSSLSARSRATALQGTALSRRENSRSGSPLGQSIERTTGGRTSGSRRSMPSSTGAAGTRAEAVTVASPAGSPAAAGGLLSSGPSATASQLADSRGQLPSGAATGAGIPSGTRNGIATVQSDGSRGLTGRATDPSARLGANEAGGGGGVAAGRSRRSTVTMPAGVIAAERAGSLVIAGPQASGDSSSGGSTSRNGRNRFGRGGQRIASLPRQSASLPQTSRRPGRLERQLPSLPGRAGRGRLPSRVTAGGAGPRLASEREIARLIRRAVPGIRAIPDQQIRPGFSLRHPDTRREAVRKMGGNDASEAAVERGLHWLATHQQPAGNWSIHDLHCIDHACENPGIFHADTAATGLALLAFLGAGNTHQTGQYRSVVERGLQWLQTQQKPDGDLFVGDAPFVWLYGHGMAAIALCETYGMTQDPKLHESAQMAIDFIVAAQHPKFGGWRYRPQFESDTSVSGWQLMALKSGEMAGLKIPKSTYTGVAHWLDTVEDEAAPGRFTYHPAKEPNLAMTAEGLLMRQYLGAKRTDKKLVAGADFLEQHLPETSEQDVYYWYYATQVMFHLQGPHWEAWNASLRDKLAEAQEKEGSVRGSWSPLLPAADKWGRAGGRHYVTCLNLLMLEVYYRHLPLYIKLDSVTP